MGSQEAVVRDVQILGWCDSVGGSVNRVSSNDLAESGDTKSFRSIPQVSGGSVPTFLGR
jgi:hypothetical protein